MATEQSAHDAIRHMTNEVTVQVLKLASTDPVWLDLVGKLSAMMVLEIRNKHVTILESMLDTVKQHASGALDAHATQPGDVTPNSLIKTTSAMLVSLIVTAIGTGSAPTQH